MTSLEVIDTDAFLDMPMSSQLLYFHLNARADDDGFVANPKKVLRTLGGSSDDYKVLTSKKFLIEFEDGVCVIKHWRINNFVRKDLYKETKYLDLKQSLFIRRNGAYTLTDDGEALPVPSGHFILEDVDRTLTERQLRIGKGRVGEKTVATAPEIVETSEDGEEKPPKVPRDPALEKAAKYWHKLSTENVGREPTGGLIKTMGIIKRAKKDLSWVQVKEMMDAWFDEQTLEDHEMIQITRCLSSFQVDKYLANV